MTKYTGSDGMLRTVLKLGPGDKSPVYSGKYDPGCSACWLGYAHTVAKHDASVKRYKAGLTNK